MSALNIVCVHTYFCPHQSSSDAESSKALPFFCALFGAIFALDAQVYAAQLKSELKSESGRVKREREKT